MKTERAQPEERFRALFAEAYPDVVRFAMRRAHPSHAEDIAADAFLVAWRRFDQLPQRPGDQRAWLFGIARNCLLNARRGQDRQHALAVRLADAAGERPGDVDSQAIAHRLDVTAAWRQLTPAEQETLSLTVFEDLTSPQAARVLGISPVAYRLRLLRARAALRRRLDTDAPDHLPAYSRMETPS